MSVHQKFMQRCLDLATNGFGTTYPNPMVGSVIVYKNNIIGEGWHQKAGEPHAEVNAINSVKDTSHLKKSTIYVSLEPCSHFGKTPPCADLIIAHNIPNVVVGCLDPNKKVAGRGVKKLLEAGRKVTVGVLEKECRDLNKRFFTFHQKKRPYIILKWAQTRDGFIAPLQQETGKPFWITNALSKQRVHQWRTQEQAILVGTHTALKDNPQLNARLWQGNNPTRVIIDRALKIPKTHHVFDGSIPSILLTEQHVANTDKNIDYVQVSFDKNLPAEICKVLYERSIQSVIVEGGRKTLQGFIDANLWDEARVFISDKELQNGIAAPVLDKQFIANEILDNDILKMYIND